MRAAASLDHTHWRREQWEGATQVRFLNELASHENVKSAVESLQSENLDFNELEAAVDALTLAITAHYPVLSDLR